MRCLASAVLHFGLPVQAGAGSADAFLDEEILPFLDWLEAAPNVKAALSFSGTLLDAAADANRKDFFARLRTLASSERVSLLLTPYYQPWPGSIPENDLHRHFELSRSTWAQRQIKAISGGILPAFGACDAMAARFSGEGLRFAYVDRTLTEQPSEPPATLMLQDSGKSLLLFPCTVTNQRSHRAVQRPAELLKTGRQLDLLSLAFDLFPADDGLPPRSALSALRMLAADPEVTFLSCSELLQLREPAVISTGGLSRQERAAAPTTASRQIQALAAELRRELDALAPVSGTPEVQEAKAQRIDAARRYYLYAQQVDLLDPDIASLPAVRQAVFDALIRGSVLADEIRAPETDPLVGWLRQAECDIDGDGEKELVIETHLARAVLKPANQGRVLEYDYKPRKINLIDFPEGAPSAAPSFELSFGRLVETVTSGRIERLTTSAQAIPDQNGGQTWRRIKHSLDLSTVRIPVQLRAPLPGGQTAAVTIFKEFTFKAALGAYLTNSTTGFSLEYWIEETGAISSAYPLILLELSFLLPSLQSADTAAFPLLPVGGISEKSVTAATACVFTSANVEGGLSGIRLVDRIEEFTVDIRSAKQLTAAAIRPGPGDHPCGAAITLALDARRITGDDHSNTIFVSIV